MTSLALSGIAGLVVLGGLAVAVVGVLGWRRRLPRNRFAGVRTVNTLRDEETFAVANQVGAPLSMAAGAVAVLGGIAALAVPAAGTVPRVTLLVLAAVGALVLTVAGGLLGDRAARRVPAPAGCGGACACCAALAERDAAGGSTSPEVEGTDSAASSASQG